MMLSSDVNGDKTNEVFKYLKKQKTGILGLARIRGSFEVCPDIDLLYRQQPPEL